MFPSFLSLPLFLIRLLPSSFYSLPSSFKASCLFFFCCSFSSPYFSFSSPSSSSSYYSHSSYSTHLTPLIFSPPSFIIPLAPTSLSPPPHTNSLYFPVFVPVFILSSLTSLLVPLSSSSSYYFWFSSSFTFTSSSSLFFPSLPFF